MNTINVLKDKCVGCKLCVNACPFGAIKIKDNKAVILENCTLCGTCVSTCKLNAIEFIKETIDRLDTSEYNGIFVFAEQLNNKIEPVVFELLGEATKLAKQLNTNVSAILLGNNLKENTKELIAYGADYVYCIENLSLISYNDETYSSLVFEIISQHKPDIVLFGATPNGRSLAPRLASKLNTGLTADCTILEIDPDKKILMQTRPAFGGNLMATIICPNHRPQMATVRPKVMKAIAPDYSREGKVITPKVTMPTHTQTKVVNFCEFEKEDFNLEEAEIIVAAGRGIGEAKNMKLIEDLAQVLRAKIGASRALVDEGLIDYKHQIGQTGKTVAPKFYFACGISGAIQHTAGITSSDIIIAINKDPDAPIFKVANFGIVGDIETVIPALIKKFKEKIR
ncbi:electron transfer flavoprotein subunit alpha [Clostridium sp. MB40-C1]|uniref:electron transfer flavoprotein subunit alpha n=1 Tax=Clostridium sp. MB40-C1 TaxID=3070996 RepID=UPI0027DF997E|nr:electron transfer flavoprotein subunit alpha [Clostridium sp. MB40-C1]WMJ80426.1 electron transfer flavoprotein subunit alpha [Clostridium sp. MB40-C1]